MSILILNSDVLLHILGFCRSTTWIQMVKTCKNIKHHIDTAPNTTFQQVFFQPCLNLPNFPKICYNPIWLDKFKSVKVPTSKNKTFTEYFSSQIYSFGLFQSHIRNLYYLFESLFNNDFQMVDFILSNMTNFNICLQDLNHIFCCLKSETHDSPEYPNDKFIHFRDLFNRIDCHIKLGNIMTKRKSILKPLQFENNSNRFHQTVRSPRQIETLGQLSQRIWVLSDPEKYLKDVTRKAFETKDREQRLSWIYLHVSHIIEHIFPDFKLHSSVRKHEPCFLCYYKLV